MTRNGSASKSYHKAPNVPPPPKGGEFNNYAWEEPCMCTGPQGERHAVRLGHDGRVAYFGEAGLPGDWKLENIPFPNSPAALGICCSPEGTPYVACVCDNGDLYLAWREGEGEWMVECVGKNALPNERVDVTFHDAWRCMVSFYCWNPMNECMEHRFIEYGRKFCRPVMHAPHEGGEGGREMPPHAPPRGRGRKY